MLSRSFAAESVKGISATHMMTFRVKFDTPIHSRKDTAPPQNTVLKRMMPNRFLMVLVIEVVRFRSFGDDWLLASGVDDTHAQGKLLGELNILRDIGDSGLTILSP